MSGFWNWIVQFKIKLEWYARARNEVFLFFSRFPFFTLIHQTDVHIHFTSVRATTSPARVFAEEKDLYSLYNRKVYNFLYAFLKIVRVCHNILFYLSNIYATNVYSD